MFRSKSTLQQHKKKQVAVSTSQFQGNSYQPQSFLPKTCGNPLVYSIRQNSSSSSSSSSTHSESLSFQKRAYKPICHQSSSSSLSHLDEHDEIEENEMKLLTEVEVVDVHGNILRIQKMTVKDVFTLLEGEKILVHVNEFDQLIKAAGGLCQRFMTLLPKEPNLCPSGSRNWKECKISCGIRLLVELRRRFSLPQRESVDKVIFAIFDEKFRTLKYRLKMTLYQLAAQKLNEANNIGEQERQYTEDELLQALDRIGTPKNFVEHQWELYKSHLRTSATKKLSQYGKKARANQVHFHTTGAVSYARKRDEFKLIHKRDANDVEFFGISHEKSKGSYVSDMSRELMDQARQEISKKVSVVGESIDAEKQSEIEREVMIELLGAEKSGRPRGFGAGVKRSQVTKFSFDLRKIRGEALTTENRYLLDKVEAQSKQIETQNKQIETQNEKLKIMEGKVNECNDVLKLFNTAFPELYGARVSSKQFPASASHADSPQV